MSTNDIANSLIRMGKQTITYTNKMHQVLSNLSDYDLSKVAITLEDNGLHLEWDFMEDVYNVY